MRGFDRPGKEEMLTLVEIAQKAFVAPVQVQEGVTLRLLTSGDNSDPKSKIVGDYFASYTTNTRPPWLRKAKKSAQAVCESTNDEE